MMKTLKEIHLQNGAVMGERNGISIPEHYGSLRDEYTALRKHILMSDYSHVGLASIQGENAWELLNILVTGDISFIRDEQAMYTLMLDGDGKIITDLYILFDDERFILFSEWMTGEQLCSKVQELLASYPEQFDDIHNIKALSPEYGTIHVEGPYSWELLAECFGMDIIGLPFLEHMHVDDLIILRGGKHGEFSYKLIATQSKLAEVWLRLCEAGEKYDLQQGGLGSQFLARLENPCWEPNMISNWSACPIELQMQWTIRYDKEYFIGSEAIKNKLHQGCEYRAVGFWLTQSFKTPPQPGDNLWLGDHIIGQVMICGFSPSRDAWIGRALIRTDLAWADIDAYQVSAGNQKVSVVTTGIPFIHNFSFAVDPLQHSYVIATRPSSVLDKTTD